MSFLNFGKKKCLGIDIGTSGIKIVELERDGAHVKLASYCFSEDLSRKLGDKWQENTKEVAMVINEMMGRAGMDAKLAVSSLPSFSVFSSVINLVKVNEKDLASAVEWEAKKVIPMPPEEMVLSWDKIKDQESSEKNGDMKVLLTAAPKFLVKKYEEIFKEAKLALVSLETESIASIRSLLGSDKSVAMLVNLGNKTTDISIVKNGIPIFSRSIDIGGEAITVAISRNLNVNWERAEQFKYDLGVSTEAGSENGVPKTILESASLIVNEIGYILNSFESKNQNKVDQIILTGGGALLTNFSNHLATSLNKNVLIGDPWFRISYPLELEPLLKEIGPKFSVAVGLAMRNM